MGRVRECAAIDVELAVGRRIAKERQKRGWSYRRLAALMAEEGCPIGSSSLWKIEHPIPGRAPRRVNVEELVVFTRVFNIDIATFLRR
jgi:transcriptional regulator with XRE-family HTH domain